MRAAQVLVGVTAHSVAAVEERVTMPQLRVLVLISSRGPLNLNAVAQALGVHPSNATRACDRLVSAGLLDRRDSVVDRRHVALNLTQAGQQLVHSVVTHRREAIASVLAKMPPAQRVALAEVMRAFADAAGEAMVAGASAMAWSS